MILHLRYKCCDVENDKAEACPPRLTSVSRACHQSLTGGAGMHFDNAVVVRTMNMPRMPKHLIINMYFFILRTLTKIRRDDGIHVEAGGMQGSCLKYISIINNVLYIINNNMKN